MAYLTINKAADSGLFVVESIRQYKDTVHENLAHLWQEKRPEETPPRFDQQLEFMADDLDASRIELVESLEVYLNESSGNQTSNVERNEAVGDMRQWYQHARGTCLNVCSIERAKELGFDMETEQHPWRLERQTQRVLNVFQPLDPEARVEADDARRQEMAPRNGYIVGVLEPSHNRLVEVLGSWISQRKGTEKAFLRKEAALEVYRRKFSIHAKSAEMLYRWAGLEEEAKRIKPSVRRPGQRAEVDDGNAEPTDSADASGDAPAADAQEAPAPVDP